MNRHPETASIVFGVLGGLLLFYLVVPLAYLFASTDWRDVVSSLGSPRALSAVRVSLITSGIATAIMTVFGVPLGYVLARARFRGRQLLISLVFVPMVLPPIVGGILLLLLYGPYGVVGTLVDGYGLTLVNSLAGIVLAQVFVAAPYVVIAALTAFGGVDEQLEQAAATLGHSRWQIFRRVSLPLAWPGIAAGVTLAWVRTLGEFGATLVMAYHPQTVPVFLWVQLTGDGLPSALPLVLVLVGLVAAVMVVTYVLNQLPVAIAQASREGRSVRGTGVRR